MAKLLIQFLNTIFVTMMTLHCCLKYQQFAPPHLGGSETPIKVAEAAPVQSP